MKKPLIAGIIAAAIMASGSACADWKLDNNQSRVNFVSVKKNEIGESHHFTQVEGKLTDQGKLNIEIPLISVETLIPIRNERLQKLLFQTHLFPTATITANINLQHFTLKAGDSKIVAVEANIGLHGHNKMMPIEVMVSRLSDDKLLVTSVKPVIIRPVDFGLSKGIDKLMAVAKLPGITRSVPVSFVLTFES
jgi:polyisoprenoid-binding protein YceI